MKKITIIILLVALIPSFSEAQLGGLINKVKSKVKNKADQKVDQEIDKTLDQVEGKNTGTNTGTVNNSTTTPEKAEESSLKSFSRYDFIPGEKVLYYDAFEGQALSELPAGWNTSGTGEVTTLDKYPGNWLSLHKPFIYLSNNKKEFGENYTMEFDLILQLKNNGWMYPEFFFGIFSTGEEPNDDNKFMKIHNKNASLIVRISPAEHKSSRVTFRSYNDTRAWFEGDSKNFDVLEKWYGIPIHIAVQVQKERFRLWINEEKIVDVPKGVPPGRIMNQLLFEVGHTNYADNQYGVYISNIKVATGKPDTRHKLVEEGKFSTTGILFDFQSAVIKPESFGVVKEIASVLKENSSIKIKIVGHTSSDGDDHANMELSKKRAASVKEMLINEFGIEATRLETEGKGETQPVADNKTAEGKVLNRRVEFLKL